MKEILQHPSLRTLSVFAGGNIIVAAIGGIGGLIQARWIGPEIAGEFGRFAILTAYFNIGLVFVNDGLSRQYPYLLGKGEKDAALKVAACAKWWYLLMSWSFSIFFAALSLTAVLRGQYRSAVGWGAQIPCVVAAFYGLYLGVMYRTSNDFKRLSYNSVIATVFEFTALPLVKVWGYWGLAIRHVLGITAGLFLNRLYVPVRVKAKFDARGFMNLVKISLPLAVPGYFGSSFLNASLRIIILEFCGFRGLGLYGIAISFQEMALIPFKAIHQMFNTRLSYKFGETEDIRACVRYSKVPTMLSLGGAIAAALALCLVIGPFIRTLLPKYEAAIPIIRILSAQLPIWAAGMPLLLIPTALLYRDLIILTLVRFFVPLAAIAICPKNITAIVTCIVVGGACRVAAGYGILFWKCHKT